MSNSEGPRQANSNWPKDRFARSELWSQWWFLWFFLALGLLGFTVTLVSIGLDRFFGRSKPTVIAYVSQDQVYAEAIFQEFEQETGIHVLTVFDSEAAKTVGLVNRLLAE